MNGTRTLTIPSVSDSFSWTAQQVAKLCNNKQAIYILALDELSCSLESEVSIVVYALWATIGVPLNHNVGRTGDIMVGGEELPGQCFFTVYLAHRVCIPQAAKRSGCYK